MFKDFIVQIIHYSFGFYFKVVIEKYDEISVMQKESLAIDKIDCSKKKYCINANVKMVTFYFFFSTKMILNN